MDWPVGAGAGQKTGGGMTYTYSELSTSAWSTTNKAALGLVLDTIQLAITELSPRYNFGYLGGFGYKSSADQPLLDHPLEAAFVALADLAATAGQSWQPIYNQLFQQISPDLQAMVQAQNNLPLESRSYAFVVLDNVLIGTAMVLAGLETLSQATSTEAVTSNTMLNVLLPFVLLQNSIGVGAEIGSSTEGMMVQFGASYPNFDAVNQTLTQLQAALATFYQINASLSNTPGGQLTPEAQASAAAVASLLTQLGSEFATSVNGNDFQMLPATMQALVMIASALSLPDTNSAPLFLALSISSIGLNQTDSSSGLIGPNLNTLLSSLIGGFGDTVLQNNNPASSLFLQMLVTTIFTTLTGMASQIIDSSLSAFPNATPSDQADAQALVFSASLQLMAGSELLNTVFLELLTTAGGGTYGSS